MNIACKKVCSIYSRASLLPTLPSYWPMLIKVRFPGRLNAGQEKHQSSF